MKETESVDQFMSQVMEVVNQLRAHGEEVTDQKVVEKILRSLPSIYDMLVTAIEESKDLSIFSIEELTGSILNYESRLNARNESLENAFQSQLNINRGTGRGQRGYRGRGRSGRRSFQFDHRNATSSQAEQPSNQPQNQRGRSRFSRGRGRGRTDKSAVQCYYCKRYGHYESDCRRKQSDLNRGRANVSNIDEDTPSMFLTCSGMQESNNEDLWLLDSGCSNHMTGNKELFSSFSETSKTQIKLGDDHFVNALGRGTVTVLSKQNEKRDIHNVYYVQDLKHNLLSVGQMSENGFDVKFKGTTCIMFDKPPSQRVIAKIEMTKNRMYPLVMRNAKQSLSYAKYVTISDETWLWHLRYGHLPFTSLKDLQKGSMVLGLPEIGVRHNPCESCILAKHRRDSFPNAATFRAHSPLELVHTDLCGPMQTQSIGGSFYFLTFIDDFSRMTWVYFIKNKSETFEKFKQFKAISEKQSGKQIKTLRSDGGGEYNSKEFSAYCRNHGIKRQFTTRYTPQQNGVAERKNQTIMNMARSMLKAKNLANEYWAEAVACSVYILNRSPTKSVKDKVPLEAWCGTKENVSHLRVFGCVAYAHIPEDIRNKLDDKSERCIFVGYSEKSKAYKLFNPITKKTIISRDVKFLEDQAWHEKENATNENQPFAYTPESVDNSNHQESRQRLPRLHVPAEEGNQGGQQIHSPSSSNESDPTIAQLRNQKTRSLREIYGQQGDEELHYALLSYQPVHFEEAVKEKVWVEAMNEEISSIEKNDTWQLVDLPPGKSSIGVKWVYKTKFNENGEVEKHKARLVAKGFAQQPGVDYDETFAPVARLDTVRTILAIAASNHWLVYQMDVKSAFLNGILKEDVYVVQPPGYEVEDQRLKVYKLKRALYGLKQAPRAWYSKIDSYLINKGFKRSNNEPTLYTKTDQQGKILIVCIYVDDIIYTGNMEIDVFRSAMEKEFEMTNLGQMKYFLGLEIEQLKEGIFVCQQRYGHSVLTRFKMSNCKPAVTPIVPGTKLSKYDPSPTVNSTLYKQLVGSLMYLTSTRPDIMLSVSIISRFMETPTEAHWKAGKRILRYVAGTLQHGIYYSNSHGSQLIGYSDSDYAGSIDDRKSTTGYAFHIGTELISWRSRKQSIISLSSAEAEYVAATSAACHAIWLRRLLADLGHKEEGPTPILCDNTSAIALSKILSFTAKASTLILGITSFVNW